MSRAEEMALETYPPKIDGDSRGSYDFNELNRIKYLQGYHQAEKDLKLTWEDIRDICSIHYIVLNEYGDYDEPTSRTLYQEVLKRFKDLKHGK